MILAKEKGARAYDVIDGQQRLTTLTILFCVLRDIYLKNVTETEDKDHLKSLVSDAVKSMTESTYRMRLVTQEHYGNLFEQEILTGVKFPKETLSKKEKEELKYKFLNAALILRKKLEEKDSKESIIEFAKFLLNNVVMITITCSSTVSAIRLFQTINTSGLELTNADLVKSYLYSTIDASDTQEKNKFVSSWQDIETIADQNEEEVEDLLNYYGYYLLAKKFQKSLYEELTAAFKGNKRRANEVVYEFKTIAEHYDKILNEKTRSIYALQNLPDEVFWKSVLITAKKVNFEEFRELSEELMKLYYSYWIADYTTAKTRDLSIKLIDSVKQKKSIEHIKKEIADRMTKDKVVERVQRNLIDEAYKTTWLKPLLVAIERAQRDESVNIEYSRNLHVDHILPQKWQEWDYWKQKWTTDQGKNCMDKIGNLTLLSGKKNIRASNDIWPKKKIVYNGIGQDGKTGFDITQNLLNNSDWTQKEFEERQKWLTGQAARVLGMQLPLS